ncbi:MAG: PAS domain S-box protein [Jaaginema sp. PMC 1079.18]|nr:PAS domain S-box protein [Jaaginema sp. PMC 1080.18]MEC4849614.1 PAS domain S-box protein [Jaaginema sp. PMC 1079.18]MEC4866212.1 PAS domain S-box protein [Jaaginema sp. PMC 1078.18]
MFSFSNSLNLLDYLPHITGLADIQGRMQQFNARWHDYTGLSESRSLGWDFLETIHPEDRDRFYREWRAAIQWQNQYTSEFRLRRHDGCYRRFIFRSEPIRHQQDPIEGWIVTYTEAKKLDRIEQELDRKQSFLDTLLDTFSDAVIACNEHGIISLFNQAALQFHNLPQAPIPSEQWAEHYSLYRPDGKTLLETEEIPLWRALKGESVRNLEMQILPKEGQARTVLVNGDPIRSEQGKILGAVVAMRDITHRQQNEIKIQQLNIELERQLKQGTDQLIQSERLYRKVVNSVEEVIFQMDREGCWRFLSPAWTKITEYPVQESLNAPFTNCVYAPEDREELQDLFAALMKGDREEFEFEYRCLTKYNNFRWLEIYVQVERQATATPEGDYPILGTYGTINDITERKQTEAILKARADELTRQRQQIHLQNLQLQEASRLKSEFLATMSHELRTPMNAIMGFSQLLMLEQPSQFQSNHLNMVERIFNNSQNLLTMLNEVLDFSKIEAGELELKPEPLDLTMLVTFTVEESRILAKRKGLTLKSQINLKNSQAIADRNCLRRILVNLISNAVKFTDIGGINIKVWEPSCDRIAIAVTDTGIGISSENTAEIFEPFWQVNQTTTRLRPGAGLGLAMTKSIVEIMKGRIIVESKLNHGSTFTVEFPRHVQ